MSPILVAVLVAAAACTGNSLDNGSSPDVVMEVSALVNPPVTAQLDQNTGLCTVQVVDWAATLENLPKNSLAGGDSVPFNDIVVTNVVIEYFAFDDFDRVNLLFGPRFVGLGDVAIPAGGSNSITFAPISFDDLAVVAPGSTLNLQLTFEAYTQEGTRITDTVDRQLFIEACI
jgi:hypothetical protein